MATYSQYSAFICINEFTALSTLLQAYSTCFRKLKRSSMITPWYFDKRWRIDSTRSSPTWILPDCTVLWLLLMRNSVCLRAISNLIGCIYDSNLLTESDVRSSISSILTHSSPVRAISSAKPITSAAEGSSRVKTPLCLTFQRVGLKIEPIPLFPDPCRIKAHGVCVCVCVCF